MSNIKRQSSIRSAVIPALASPLVLGIVLGFPAGGAGPWRFARTYGAAKPVHLGITGRNGDVTINSWNRREIYVKALSAAPVDIHDSVMGNAVNIDVNKPQRTKVDFEIAAPDDTSIQVKSTMGRVTISGINGHITIDTVNGNIHLMGVRSPCVMAKTLDGDIFFDGELAGDGPFDFQSMTGDIDISLPESVSFDLVAQSLASNINLGGFLLSPRNQHGEGVVSGKHQRGGPRLNLTTFNGRILLHKK
ncbi:MAG TPA: DUF4097 family beta strand repeat-containing protein [Blastocatellia bacterium]|nr:DUF4097 family beta strand repeat-containing protein [Blastocatellia bacterium]